MYDISMLDIRTFVIAIFRQDTCFGLSDRIFVVFFLLLFGHVQIFCVKNKNKLVCFRMVFEEHFYKQKLVQRVKIRNMSENYYQIPFLSGLGTVSHSY